MAYTQTQLTELQAAIASGALTVKYQDKTVTYRSMAEMQQLLSLMQDDINGRPTTTNGLCGIPLVSKYKSGH